MLLQEVLVFMGKGIPLLAELHLSGWSQMTAVNQEVRLAVKQQQKTRRCYCIDTQCLRKMILKTNHAHVVYLFIYFFNIHKYIEIVPVDKPDACVGVFAHVLI